MNYIFCLLLFYFEFFNINIYNYKLLALLKKIKKIKNYIIHIILRFFLKYYISTIKIPINIWFNSNIIILILYII